MEHISGTVFSDRQNCWVDTANAPNCCKGVSNVSGGRGQPQLCLSPLRYTAVFCPLSTICSCYNHCFCLSSAEVNSKSARVLFLLVVPGHLVFLYTIHLLQGGHTSLSFTFVMFYLTAALLQVSPKLSSKKYHENKTFLAGQAERQAPGSDPISMRFRHSILHLLYMR